MEIESKQNTIVKNDNKILNTQAQIQKIKSQDTNITKTIKVKLLVGKDIPVDYLNDSEAKMPYNKRPKSGHRGTLLDLIDPSSNRIYYSVKYVKTSPIDTSFTDGQEFNITLTEEQEQNNDKLGLKGIPDLEATLASKKGILEYIWSTLSDTYDGTDEGIAKLKSKPLCKKPKSIEEIESRISKLSDNKVVVFSLNQDDTVRYSRFIDYISKFTNIKRDEVLDKINKKEIPEYIIDKARRFAYSDKSLSSIKLSDKEMELSTDGKYIIKANKNQTKLNNQVKFEHSKPQSPMDMVGLPARDIPINDLMPKGNVLTVHAARMPVLDDIVGLGGMVYEFVQLSNNLYNLFKSFNEIGK